MNAHTNKGFASRIGFGLGMLVRFCLHDRRPAIAVGQADLPGRGAVRYLCSELYLACQRLHDLIVVWVDWVGVG